MLHFSNLTKTDLYLLVSEYKWMLREAYTDEADLNEANKRFTKTLAQISPEAAGPGKRVSQSLRNAPWLDAFIMDQERRAFAKNTKLDLVATVPGAYGKMTQHINDHRWFLGIAQNREQELERA